MTTDKTKTTERTTWRMATTTFPTYTRHRSTREAKRTYIMQELMRRKRKEAGECAVSKGTPKIYMMKNHRIPIKELLE
jgi:hypothetical protein